jgi:drug/metabolite transporter (DMT)-like permease
MSSRTRAELLLFSITFIWGSTFVVSKYLLSFVTPLVYIAVRFAIAALIFAAIFFRRVKGMTRSSLLKGGILGGLLFFGFATQMIGLQYTSASKSAFITGMTVVFTPICQLLIERRAPKLGNIIGVVLVTFGLYLLTSLAGAEFNLGDGLNLLCAVSFALYIVYLDIFSKEADSAQLTLMQFITCAVLGAVTSGFFENAVFTVSNQSLLALGYLIVFATIIAIYVQVRFQKDTTPTRSAIIFSIEPVIAATIAYFALGEVIGIIGIAGGGLIVAGLLVSELSPA